MTDSNYHLLLFVYKKKSLNHSFTFQAGIIEEMLEDTFESMEDEEEMEEAAEEEVDKILFEITAGEVICSTKSSQYCYKPVLLYVLVSRFWKNLSLNHHRFMNYTTNE